MHLFVSFVFRYSRLVVGVNDVVSIFGPPQQSPNILVPRELLERFSLKVSPKHKLTLLQFAC